MANRVNLSRFRLTNRRFYVFTSFIAVCYSIYKIIRCRFRKKDEEIASSEENESIESFAISSQMLHVHDPSHCQANFDDIKNEIYRDVNLTLIEKESLQIEILDNGCIQILFDFENSGLSLSNSARRKNYRIVEKETNTQLIFPRKRRPDGNTMIRITGREVGHILLAYKKIKSSFSSTGFVPKKLTHFISVPMNVIHLQENFEQFKKEVLKKCGGDRGVCRELFQKKEKLHLTFGVMNLSNDIQTQLAFHVLEECKERLIRPLVLNERIVVQVRGIGCMNSNSSKAYVLYGKIENSAILQRLADKIVDSFIQADLMRYERKQVLLHLTLMNSKFLRKVSKKAKSKNPQLLEKTFDAQNILQNFENYEFGPIEIETIHLSQFSTVGRNGYYAASYEINF